MTHTPPTENSEPHRGPHIKAFNTHDDDLFFSLFFGGLGDTAIIIDGIAPYRWLNPNLPANWLADVEKWARDLGVSDEHLPTSSASGISRVRSHMRSYRARSV